MRNWLLFFIFLSLLWAKYLAADAFSGTKEARHQHMIRFFSEHREHPKSWKDWHYMTDGWGGGRAFLARKGVTISSSITTDVMANPSGGAHHGIAQASSWGLDVDMDLGRLADLPGWELYNSWVWRWGTNLSVRKIHNFFPVQQVYGSETIKMNNLFLRITSLNQKISLKLGRLNAGDDFLQSDLYYCFVNNAFDGNPISVFFNTPFDAYPNAVWGAYLYFKPYKRIIGKLALYEGNGTHVNLNKYHGLNFTFRSTHGLLVVNEWTYLANQEEDDKGLSGNYKAAVIISTDHKRTFRGNTIENNYMVYVMMDQMIYRGGPKKTRYLTPFAAFLFAPEGRNLFPFFCVAGLVFQGPSLSRPNDFAAFGVAYGRFSEDLRQAEQAAHKEQQGAETVLELNYKIQITPWFYIQPDVQYIITPSGLSSIPNAFCIGFQSQVVF